MSLQLFSHNQSAFESVLEMLEDCGKAAVIHPTGTGKSYIGFKLCEQFPDKNICWLSPSEYIYKTQLENVKDDSDGWQPENVLFFTYAKLMLMSDEEVAEIQPDYIILDEFHRCGAEMWGEGVKRLLTMYLDAPLLGLSATAIRYLDNQRDMADELFDGNVASEMTLGEAIVRGILNPPKYVLSVFAYQEDYDRLKHRVSKAKYKEIKSKAEKYLEALRRALEKADGMDIIFDKHMTDRMGKYIVFCSNMAHLREMRSKVKEWFGKIDPHPHIYSVYSEDPTTSQDFVDFKNDDSDHLKLLFAIDMLNEGIHVDDVSGVILFRPTVSPIIYKQQIGRALSTSKSKDPIIFDIVNNIENLYSISSIQEEMEVAISYYRFLGQDGAIVNDRFEVVDEVREAKELFDQLNDTLIASWNVMYHCAKAYYEKHGNLMVPEHYKTEEGYSLGSWLRTQRLIYTGKIKGSLTDDKIHKLNEIGMRWDSMSDLTWKRNYAEAIEYYEKHGDLMIPATYVTKSGIRLGSWINNIRTYRKSGAKSSYLSPERIKQLDSIGMIWDGLDYIWEQNYAAAVAYYHIHGDLNVPPRYVDKNGIRLYDWLGKLRLEYKRDKSDYLSEERIQALNRIGMEWRSLIEKRWYDAYSLALEYYETYGNLEISQQYKTPNGFTLGAWLNTQKKRYRAGQLKEEYIDLLDQIHINWEKSSKAYTWDEMFCLAERFYQEHGHLVVPSDYQMDGVWIARWISNQRQRYIGKKQPPLTQDEIQKLESIGMFWGTKSDREWKANFKEAQAYYEEHGDLAVPMKYITASGVRLGYWISRIRRSAAGDGSRMTLTTERIEQLNRIGMIWKHDEYLWERNYSSAEKYYNEHGDLNVPAQYIDEDGIRLYGWLNKIRDDFNNHNADYLTSDRIAALNRIGMIWLKPLQKRWYDVYLVLKKYYDTHGNVDVPYDYITPDGVKVWYWLNKQKKRYLAGKLEEDRFELLNNLNVFWDNPSETYTWDDMFRFAEQFYQNHGHLVIPSGYKINGAWVARWVSHQRQRYMGKEQPPLSSEEIKKLESIGIFWGSLSERKWQEQFVEVKEYFAEHGNIDIPDDYVSPSGRKTKNWITLQKKNIKNNLLTDKQLSLLHSIGLN